jgi:hypothetical protein
LILAGCNFADLVFLEKEVGTVAGDGGGVLEEVIFLLYLMKSRLCRGDSGCLIFYAHPIMAQTLQNLPSNTRSRGREEHWPNLASSFTTAAITFANAISDNLLKRHNFPHTYFMYVCVLKR